MKQSLHCCLPLELVLKGWGSTLWCLVRDKLITSVVVHANVSLRNYVCKSSRNTRMCIAEVLKA